MKVRLKIKEFNGTKFACSNLFVHPEHLPDVALKAMRQKVLPGEVFEVPTKEDAQVYLKSGKVEIVL